jgi:hypothetical protein
VKIRWIPFTIPVLAPSRTYPEKAWSIGDEKKAAVRSVKNTLRARWFRDV